MVRIVPLGFGLHGQIVQRRAKFEIWASFWVFVIRADNCVLFTNNPTSAEAVTLDSKASIRNLYDLRPIFTGHRIEPREVITESSSQQVPTSPIDLPDRSLWTPSMAGLLIESILRTQRRLISAT